MAALEAYARPWLNVTSLLGALHAPLHGHVSHLGSSFGRSASQLRISVWINQIWLGGEPAALASTTLHDTRAVTHAVQVSHGGLQGRHAQGAEAVDSHNHTFARVCCSKPLLRRQGQRSAPLSALS